MWNQQIEDPQHQLTVPLGVGLHNASYKIFASWEMNAPSVCLISSIVFGPSSLFELPNQVTDVDHLLEQIWIASIRRITY